MIPAESSSVAAAIRSSIFCCRLPKILVGAGFGGASKAMSDSKLTAARGGAEPPCPRLVQKSSSAILDRWPRAFWKQLRRPRLGPRFRWRHAPHLAQSPGLWLGASGRGRLFPHRKSVFLKFASGFGMKMEYLTAKLRGLHKPIQGKTTVPVARVPNWESGVKGATVSLGSQRSSGDRSIVRAEDGPDSMTSDPFVPLSDLERDALAELSNIAMAKAANSLRQMIQHEVLLAVPSVEILTSAAATQLVAKPDNPKLVAVRQDFAGAFSGRATADLSGTKQPRTGARGGGPRASAR